MSRSLAVSASLLTALLATLCIITAVSSQQSVVITIDVSGGGRIIVNYVTPDGNSVKVAVKEGVRKIETLNGTIMNVTAIPGKDSKLLTLLLDGNQVTDAMTLTLIVGQDLKSKLEAIFIPAWSEEPSLTPTLTIRVTQTPIGEKVLINSSIRVLGDITCPANLMICLDVGDEGCVSTARYYPATPGYYLFTATINASLLHSWTTSLPGRVAAELLCEELELATGKADIIIRVPPTQSQEGGVSADLIIVGVGVLAIILAAALIHGRRENINT